MKKTAAPAPTIYHPKGSMCMACQHRRADCSHLSFRSMEVIERTPTSNVVKCTNFEARRS